MRASLAFGLPLILALAACATPQEQCINRATRDLRVVEGLIAQLQIDVDRGYRMVSHEYTVTRWVPCGLPPPPPTAPGAKPPPPPPPRMCLRDLTRVVQRPEAIDIAAETRKLAQLKLKRRELTRAAGPAVAACKAAYPE